MLEPRWMLIVYIIYFFIISGTSVEKFDQQKIVNCQGF